MEPDLDLYKKLHRVGRGSLELSKEGLNFHSGNKFYRFDFYRIESVKKGRNYLAVSIKGGEVVRLFVFDRESPRIEDVHRGFNTFAGGR
jgi:hypothetical protein